MIKLLRRVNKLEAIMRFFVLISNPLDDLTTAGTEFLSVDDNLSDAPTCQACSEFIGPLRGLPPYRIELETWGNEFGDIAFGGSIELLVSQRFKELFEREGLIGLEDFEPVNVVRVLKYKRIKGTPPQ